MNATIVYAIAARGVGNMNYWRKTYLEDGQEVDREHSMSILDEIANEMLNDFWSGKEVAVMCYYPAEDWIAVSGASVYL